MGAAPDTLPPPPRRPPAPSSGRPPLSASFTRSQGVLVGDLRTVPAAVHLASAATGGGGRGEAGGPAGGRFLSAAQTVEAMLHARPMVAGHGGLPPSAHQCPPDGKVGGEGSSVGVGGGGSVGGAGGVSGGEPGVLPPPLPAWVIIRRSARAGIPEARIKVRPLRMLTNGDVVVRRKPADGGCEEQLVRRHRVVHIGPVEDEGGRVVVPPQTPPPPPPPLPSTSRPVRTGPPMDRSDVKRPAAADGRHAAPPPVTAAVPFYRAGSGGGLAALDDAREPTGAVLAPVMSMSSLDRRDSESASAATSHTSASTAAVMRGVREGAAARTRAAEAAAAADWRRRQAAAAAVSSVGQRDRRVEGAPPVSRDVARKGAEQGDGEGGVSLLPLSRAAAPDLPRRTGARPTSARVAGAAGGGSVVRTAGTTEPDSGPPALQRTDAAVSLLGLLPPPLGAAPAGQLQAPYPAEDKMRGGVRSSQVSLPLMLTEAMESPVSRKDQIGLTDGHASGAPRRSLPDGEDNHESRKGPTPELDRDVGGGGRASPRPRPVMPSAGREGRGQGGSLTLTDAVLQGPSMSSQDDPAADRTSSWVAMQAAAAASAAKAASLTRTTEPSLHPGGSKLASSSITASLRGAPSDSADGAVPPVAASPSIERTNQQEKSTERRDVHTAADGGERRQAKVSSSDRSRRRHAPLPRDASSGSRDVDELPRPHPPRPSSPLLEDAPPLAATHVSIADATPSMPTRHASRYRDGANGKSGAGGGSSSRHRHGQRRSDEGDRRSGSRTSDGRTKDGKTSDSISTSRGRSRISESSSAADSGSGVRGGGRGEASSSRPHALPRASTAPPSRPSVTTSPPSGPLAVSAPPPAFLVGGTRAQERASPQREAAAAASLSPVKRDATLASSSSSPVTQPRPLGGPWPGAHPPSSRIHPPQKVTFAAPADAPELAPGVYIESPRVPRVVVPADTGSRSSRAVSAQARKERNSGGLRSSGDLRRKSAELWRSVSGRLRWFGGDETGGGGVSGRGRRRDVSVDVTGLADFREVGAELDRQHKEEAAAAKDSRQTEPVNDGARPSTRRRRHHKERTSRRSDKATASAETPETDESRSRRREARRSGELSGVTAEAFGEPTGRQAPPATTRRPRARAMRRSSGTDASRSGETSGEEGSGGRRLDGLFGLRRQSGISGDEGATSAAAGNANGGGKGGGAPLGRMFSRRRLSGTRHGDGVSGDEGTTSGTLSGGEGGPLSARLFSRRRPSGVDESRTGRGGGAEGVTATRPGSSFFGHRRHRGNDVDGGSEDVGATGEPAAVGATKERRRDRKERERAAAEAAARERRRSGEVTPRASTEERHLFLPDGSAGQVASEARVHAGVTEEHGAASRAAENDDRGHQSGGRGGRAHWRERKARTSDASDGRRRRHARRDGVDMSRRSGIFRA